MFKREMITTRIVTVEECDWLPSDVPAGTLVTAAHDRYSCCSPAGTFVNIIGWNHCPVELPKDCLSSLDAWARAVYI